MEGREGWKKGGMSGRMEDWKVGRLDDRKDGRNG
jgi:hypothetical protein